jgi:transposase
MGIIQAKNTASTGGNAELTPHKPYAASKRVNQSRRKINNLDLNYYRLSDKQYLSILNLLPLEKSGKRGRPWLSHQATIEGILWVLATNRPWEQLPAKYGTWKTVYDRCRRWKQVGIIQQILGRLLADLDDQQQLHWQNSANSELDIKTCRHIMHNLIEGAVMPMSVLRWAAQIIVSNGQQLSMLPDLRLTQRLQAVTG